MQRTCSRSAERRAVCVKYNKRAPCIITLSFRGKNVEYKCGNVRAAVPLSSLCTDDNLDRTTEHVAEKLNRPSKNSPTTHLSASHLSLFLCVNTEISFQVVSLE